MTGDDFLIQVSKKALVRDKASGWHTPGFSQPCLRAGLVTAPLDWDKENEGQEGVIITCWKMSPALLKGCVNGTTNSVYKVG